MSVRTDFKTVKAALKSFDEIFNDQNLTEFGRIDRINNFKDCIQQNVELYGKANI
jgi:hypothetical protein